MMFAYVGIGSAFSSRFQRGPSVLPTCGIGTRVKRVLLIFARAFFKLRKCC